MRFKAILQRRDDVNKVRCCNCGRVLLLIEFGKLRIKCPKCGHINGINIDKESPTESQSYHKEGKNG